MSLGSLGKISRQRNFLGISSMSSKLLIVVPCLNEEKYIGGLLKSLASQSDQDFELVIVDGKSTDGTLLEIKKFELDLPQLRVIKSEERGVSLQRNLGARDVDSQEILFLDADSRLDVDYIKEFKTEAGSTGADIAMAYIWPDSLNPLDWFFWLGGNVVTDLSKYVWPLGYGMNLYIKRNLFDKIGGFDESITVAEDVDLVKRGVAVGGKYVILKKPKYFTDPRRLRKEGHLGFLVKNMLIAWQAHRRGGFGRVDVEYRMGEWDVAEKEERSLFESIKEKMIFWK
jgi:glycosyltransferase involved in cell wall biosynthesis